MSAQSAASSPLDLRTFSDAHSHLLSLLSPTSLPCLPFSRISSSPNASHTSFLSSPIFIVSRSSSTTTCWVHTSHCHRPFGLVHTSPIASLARHPQLRSVALFVSVVSHLHRLPLIVDDDVLRYIPRTVIARLAWYIPHQSRLLLVTHSFAQSHSSFLSSPIFIVSRSSSTTTC
ncbi:hypothetical protein A0H81_10356 [Grifola frondosa]|uniref:Uncharacterized protein n=1 Tax=Grifola frondosa TaxID=5627 RepID=A0A1C7LYI3_GRIFR|nr:hypothetical protein A0H81_10356 [Grifola frondosa]